MAVARRSRDPDEEGSEADLIEKARQGDRNAFWKLFGMYRPQIQACLRIRLGRNCRLPLELEDLVGEVALVGCRRIRDFDPTCWKLTVWFICIARQVLADTYRKLRAREGLREPHDFARDVDPVDPDLTPRGRLVDKELRLRVHRAIRELHPRDGEVVWYHYFQGLTLTEIGHILGLWRETVSHRHRRALARLQQILGEP